MKASTMLFAEKRCAENRARMKRESEEEYAITILNKVFDKLSITPTEKVELTNKFIEEIRDSRN